VDSPQVEIRRATEDDLPGMEWEGEFRHFRRLYRAAFLDACQGRKTILLAKSDGVIVGQLIVQFGTDLACLPRPELTGYLYSFRVREGFRGRGVGSQLIETAEAALRERDYQQAAIAAAKVNPRARRLYERLGYSVVGEDPGQWSYLDDRGIVRNIAEPAHILAKGL